MNLDDMILTSVDDHVVEPPDRFERHTPSKYRNRPARAVTDVDTITRSRAEWRARCGSVATAGHAVG